MKEQYDFSKGQRGKFYRRNARFNIPVYLEDEVRTFVERIADREGSDVSSVVNGLLRADMKAAGRVKK